MVLSHGPWRVFNDIVLGGSIVLYQGSSTILGGLLFLTCSFVAFRGLSVTFGFKLCTNGWGGFVFGLTTMFVASGRQ